MKIKRIVGGQLDTNCYIVSDDTNKSAVLIDPGFYNDELKTILSEYNHKIKAILLTHTHFDHIMGLVRSKNEVNCKVYAHKYDAIDISDERKNCYALFQKNSFDFSEFKVDVLLNDKDKLNFDDIEIKVIHTPGHTKGGVCYIIGDCIFTGDTLFKCSVGNPNFYGGDAQTLLRSVQLLSDLESDFCIFPGHGDDTTLVYEKQFNPYMRKF